MFLFPLTRPNRIILAKAFATVPRVDISIECVLQDHMGKAFVDSLDNPKYFMIEMDNFFLYFAGDYKQAAGRDFMSKMPTGRMLMAGTSHWQETVESIFQGQLIKIQRHNHSSDNLSLTHLQTLVKDNPNSPCVKRFDLALVQSNPPFLEYGAFDSAEDFVQRGIGFAMIKEGQVIGAAYSSLVANNAIEVSVVVDSKHRRQGIATALCAQLLQYCVTNHIAPHWDAANEESCLLAAKLGYEKTEDYQAYFLKPSA